VLRLYCEALSSVRVGGVRFWIIPQDHLPAHAHGHYAETVAVVVLLGNGMVELADRDDAILPRGAKESDVRKILRAARDHYDEIMAVWERMQG
jgi:hypothetical protein